MSRRRPGGFPIFWQTLLLLFASLAVSLIVATSQILFLPPPRPDFNRLGDVAEALIGQDRGDRGGGERGGRGERERGLIITTQRLAPVLADGMTSRPDFTARLADRMGVGTDRVRFFYEPDQRSSFPFSRLGSDPVPMRRGEPIFFNTIVAAYDTGKGWRVAQTPPKPALSNWQKRTITWFALSSMLLLPAGWFFARRLTRPIRRFADAADRLGNDPFGPPVPVEGPAELRVTAHALNQMQQRLADYVRERTAMIGAIAHDLRTPLARIAFRIEAAPEGVREKVQADIEQMRAMVAATIGFVKGTTYVAERVPIDLADLIGRQIAVDREMGRPVHFAAQGRGHMLGDPVALARLFQNLFDNALSYGQEAEIALQETGGRIAVTVADRGPGLAEEELERMFQPFERGDPSRNRTTGGIGLGLTIARSIAADHGGTLTLANRPGGGLVARCELPGLE
ncbi:ATP-binding protein [Flavisphingomonas formosensis]|uniref:ATP-binding protein n=1 Tax=Flavisphingomonas formosensis TaxID=861534 RepID=UPI0012F7C0AA|nr:ATP-binding protein [Sphingomonas formosensis]